MAQAFIDKNGKEWIIFPAKYIFDMFTTYGFPPEMTEEIARENGFICDMNGYKKLFKEHQEKSRQSCLKKFGKESTRGKE
jgi:alanyl-tRNA synthetase